MTSTLHNNTNFDEEDEIIEEIDVKLTETLAKYIYLFQYPNQHPDAQEPNQGFEIQVKPTFEKFQIKVPLDPNVDTYSQEKGKELFEGTHNEPIGLNQDGMRKVKQENGDSLLKYQTLTSYHSPSQTSNFIAVMNDNELHLTPIKSIVQLRPSFEVIDKIDEKRKNANKKKDLKDENQDKVTSVYPRIQLQDEDRQEPIVETATKLKNEKWVSLKYYDASVSKKTFT
jgi:DNA-directed RNA polymerase-3 subunit RPC5